jgi:hypothetical protein
MSVRHFGTGFQPSELGAVRTQPFGLGCDGDAPLALMMFALVGELL